MTTINVAVVTPDAEPWPYAVVTVRLIDAGSGGAVEEAVVTGISTIYCDADGEGTIALTPNEDISPAGTFYAFAVENSSPSTVRCIEVPDSGTALSWADPTIQVLVDDPPVFIPAPSLADALKVVRVNSSGDAYELGTSGAGDVAGDTHAATSKATPVDADEIPLADSAASFGLKKLTWANLKATAKTYFDTLYSALGHAHAGSDITSGTVGTARLGSGTANSGTYLRGDQTWAAVSGSSTVDVVSNVANNVLLGRTTAGSGDSEEITVAASRLVGRAASGDIDDLDAAAVKTLLAYAVGDVSGAAPLASPTFTGTPAAPTAAVGTSTTQLASTAFVQAADALLKTPAVTTATATNTTTITPVATLTIPGGELVAGDAVRMFVMLEQTNNSGGTVTCLLRAKFGSTTILTLASTFNMGSSANKAHPWVELDLFIETTTAQRLSGRLDLSFVSSATWPRASSTDIGSGYGVATEDTSTAKDLVVSVEMGSAVSGVSIGAVQAMAQFIKKR